ncbi:unnamed protein product [Schistosoma turkestanicum]|nr:unnamed protein product [Schistosoma turkestanicum]
MRTSNKLGGTSGIITDEENSILLSLMGAGCKSLAAAVVQYYQGEWIWRLKDCGVACCIKDTNYEDYFIRIYCVERKILLFEQRLFLEMDYTEETRRFHAFQSSEGPFGLAFASLLEAKHFLRKINGCLRSMRATVDEEFSSNLHAIGSHAVLQDGICNLNQTELSDQGLMSIRNKKKSKRKKKLTSKDTSNPSDFRHIEHVGHDREPKIFDIPSQESAIIRNKLRAIGREDAMNVPSEQTFVYNIAREHGGLLEMQRPLIGCRG